MINDSPLTAFLPCRKGSERVISKNTKPFGIHQNGLVSIKMSQLLKVNQLDSIIVSTNDEIVIDYCSRLSDSRVIIHARSEDLCRSLTSTDDVITHAASLVDYGHILWTHVTSPFVTSSIYCQSINTYKHILKQGFDSLMSVTPLKNFLWEKTISNSRPTNYDRSFTKWPRTQDLKTLYEVNSALFIASADIYKFKNDRIGQNPFLFPLDKKNAFDIDWEEDFEIAQAILSSNLVEL